MEVQILYLLQYLKDYYLLTAVGVILLIAVAVSLIWHVARPRTENLLYAAVIDESLDEKKLAQVTADMSNLLGADGKRKTVQIDVVILDPPGLHEVPEFREKCHQGL